MIDPFVDSGGMPRLGIPDMDLQHRRIYQALQRLVESLRGRYPLENLGDRLSQLESLTLEHFRDEEELMEVSGYSLLLAHRAEHEHMIERCHALLNQFSVPGSPPLDQLAETFLAMLLNHIQNVDMDYSDFLEAAEMGRAERPVRSQNGGC